MNRKLLLGLIIFVIILLILSILLVILAKKNMMVIEDSVPLENDVENLSSEIISDLFLIEYPSLESDIVLID